MKWEHLHQQVGGVSNVLKVISLAQSIPAHSADCERGFSLMKQIKSDWRSRLTSQRLTSLMMIKLRSPSIKDFNPDTAINVWHTESSRARRPFQMPYGPRTKDSDCVVSDCNSVASDNESEKSSEDEL
jgi:hypothetical protein